MKTLRDLIGSLVVLSLVSALGCTTPGNKNSATSGCQDGDGDGYGQNCPRGPDCDDNDRKRNISCDCNALPFEGCPCQGAAPLACFETSNATLVGIGPCRAGQRECASGKWSSCVGQVLPEVESCDQIDNDCNGKVDDSAACTSCGARCSQEVTGGNGTNSAGFRVDQDNSNGLTRTPEGFLILTEQAQSEGMKFMYVANADEGTVTKIEIRTGKEVGRYISALTKTDPRNRGTAQASGNSPSRTAVDFNGDVWVANRAFNQQGSATKIAHQGCPDVNGNGKIETSNDANGNGVIDLNDPKEYFGESDECILFTVNVGGINAIPRALALDGGGVDVRKSNAWVGAWTEQKFYKLDGEDGHILATVDVGLKPYGAAIDSSGMLWSTEFNASTIVSISTMTNTANPVISLLPKCTGSYGIAIDQKNRVWVGGWDFKGACRYDPADGSIFPVVIQGMQGHSRGIAVDAEGYIWSAFDGSPGTVARFKADDGSALKTFTLPNGNGTIGVGIDFDGKAWAVNRESNNTCRIDGNTGVIGCYPTGKGPYTYSDFTGFALQHITAPMGMYRTIFKGCMSEQQTKWRQLSWDALVPANSGIEVYVKAGNTIDELQTARRQGPYTNSPVDLSTNDKIVGEQLWVEVVLSSQKQGATPTLKSLSIQKICGGVD